jgi:hypothetical protein
MTMWWNSNLIFESERLAIYGKCDAVTFPPAGTKLNVVVKALDRDINEEEPPHDTLYWLSRC